MDENVKREIEQVNQFSPTEIAEYRLVLKNLSNKENTSCLCLAVEPSSCIGLIGLDKSSKNKLIRKITGQKTIFSGDVFLNGLSLKSSWIASTFSVNFGYCSDQCALLKYSTGRENLEVFGLMKGIPRFLIHKEIRKIARELELNDFLDKPVFEFNESTRKKFGIAIALMGDPKLILLDEPSLGLDENMKQKLLIKLEKMKSQGKSILLFSNDTKDFESVCSKILIASKDEIKCVGTPLELKNRFTQGISIHVQLKPQEGIVKADYVKEVKEFMQKSIKVKEIT